jgi:predicted CXXCH cytochrome family protein
MTKPLNWAFLTVLPFCLAVVSATPAAKKKDFPISPGESCLSASCHADMAKKKFVHAVAADGATCILCHQIAKEGRHSFALTAKGGALCAQCHGVKADKKYKHVPVEAGLCTFCHNPHQSDNPKQLNFPPTAELCLLCHNPETFNGTVVHGPVLEGQCIKCHNPHTSDHPKQLEAAVPNLCFGCHDRPQKDAKGRRLPPPKATFDDEEMKHHLPFGAGQCLWCHNPHASPNYRLLRKAYPESLTVTTRKHSPSLAR